MKLLGKGNFYGLFKEAKENNISVIHEEIKGKPTRESADVAM